MMNNLQERYLHAVRWALPSGKADDIVAELRDILATRAEDREEALGRPLTTDETSAMLKDFGHPLIVAARYRPQQWLIGPDVYPFYIFALRIVLLISLGIQAAVAGARMVFGDGRPLQIAAQSWGGLWMSLIISIGVVTIIFAVMERAGFPADHIKRWVPDQLPDVKDKRKSVWESVFEIAAGILFLLWWAGIVHFPMPTGGADFRIEAAPIFAQLYWPIFALVAVRLVDNLIEWVRPRWTLVRSVLTIGTTIAGLVLLALIYRAGQWATIVSTGMPADKVAQLGEALNLSLKIAIVVTGVVWTWQAVVVLWRLLRKRQRDA